MLSIPLRSSGSMLVPQTEHLTRLLITLLAIGQAAVSASILIVIVSLLKAAAPADTILLYQIALCCEKGMSGGANPVAYEIAAALKVTPVGAVFSSTTVCSVALRAAEPRPISQVSSGLEVLEEM